MICRRSVRGVALPAIPKTLLSTSDSAPVTADVVHSRARPGRATVPGPTSASNCQPRQQLSTLARINFGPHVTGGTPGNNFILVIEVDPRSLRSGSVTSTCPGPALADGDAGP